MKKSFLLLLLFLTCWSLKAQNWTSYQPSISKKVYSTSMDDSMLIEITVPKEIENTADSNLPIIYLLDMQLANNYKYNINTIDYLSSLQWMPKSIIVGVSFNPYKRTKWTVPNATGGKADDMISFISEEIYTDLSNKYPVSNFNLLVGHSRTAILSSYALSKKPEFFNGVIASSVANFDFGDVYQEKQFEEFLSTIPSAEHKYYYYFSVGEKAYGDMHEPAVDMMNMYLQSHTLPQNLEWKFYKNQVAHDVTPGLTVSQSLSQIFKAYGKRMDDCFEIAKQYTDRVPWEEYQSVFSIISSDLDFEVKPSYLFFNSIASAYNQDYDKVYGENANPFALEIVLEAINTYPTSFDYHAWAAELYYTLNDFKNGDNYYDKTIELVNADSSLTDSDREFLLKEMEEYKNQLTGKSNK